MEDFNVQEVVTKFQAAEIYIIPAYIISTDVSLMFIGNLDDFILAVKAVEARTVIMETHSLLESDFFDESDGRVYGVYENPSDNEELSKQIYLPTFLPELEKYKDYIGETHYLRFLVFYQSQVLSYMHETPLYKELEKLHEKADEKFEKLEHKARLKYEEELLKQSEATAQIKAEYLGKLESLLDDNKFVRLGTQRAMQAYTLEVFPELKEMDVFELKNEIQNLSDRLKARKLFES